MNLKLNFSYKFLNLNFESLNWKFEVLNWNASELSAVADRGCFNPAAHSSPVLFLPATLGWGRWGGVWFVAQRGW